MSATDHHVLLESLPVQRRALHSRECSVQTNLKLQTKVGREPATAVGKNEGFTSVCLV